MGDAVIEELRPFLARLHRLLVEIDQIERRKAIERTKAFPPASEVEIAAREKSLDFRFPPSYRAFLKLHNGWRNLPGLSFIFGVSGPGYTMAARGLSKNLKSYEKILRYQGVEHSKALEEKERTDPDVIYMFHHPVVASDSERLTMVFDRNRPTQGGEYQIASVKSGQLVEERYRSFMDLLVVILRRAQLTLAELGGNPETLA